MIAADWAENCIGQVGGQDELIRSLTGQLSRRIEGQTRVHAAHAPNLLAILFQGHSGNGKRHLARTLAETSGLGWKLIQLADYRRMDMLQAAPMLRSLFMDPSCQFFVLENVEMLLGQSGDHHLTSLRCLLTELLDELAKGPRLIAVIGTSSRETQDSSLFAQRHRIAFSTAEQRLAVLRIILQPLSISDVDAEAIAKRTHGFSVADLVKLKFEAFALATRHNRDTMTADDFIVAVESAVCRPSLMAEYWQRLPEQRFDELVGLDAEIARLQDLVLLPFQQAALCARFGIGLPRGILVHGPTGSGKTHLALALVRHAGLNYIPISAPSIRSKYVGEAEKRLAAVFQRARDCAPSILLIDHIEALVGRRQSGDSSSSSGSSERLITCFLTEMDGIAAKGSESQVLVIGVTDAIHKMDPAMVRPGRLGTHIALPGSLDRHARERYLTGVTKVPLRLSEAERNLILDRTEGYSGARLRSLVEEAALDALAQDQDIVTIANFFKP